MEYIPLEYPIAELETKIDTLKKLAAAKAINLDTEISGLECEVSKLQKEMFSRLTPYQAVQMSRHPRRPTTLQLLSEMTSSFIELHGDRNFLDDKAIVGGLAKIGPYSCIVIGHQKGRGTKENIYRNFGMPRPEGYRKALRMMSMAERFNLPIVTFIDTPGAYPGVGAEERGQSEAIGKNILVMSRLKVPIISIVVGEGGSGGALAIAVANRVFMLEHSTYSVISPEGCASILMKDSKKASEAADALKLTAKNALKLGVIDGVIPEPRGGAHTSPKRTAATLKEVILKNILELKQWERPKLSQQRVERFLAMGSLGNGNQHG